MEFKQVKALMSQVSLIYTMTITQMSISLACLLLAYEDIAINLWVYLVSIALGFVVVAFARPYRIMSALSEGYCARRLLDTIKRTQK